MSLTSSEGREQESGNELPTHCVHTNACAQDNTEENVEVEENLTEKVLAGLGPLLEKAGVGGIVRNDLCCAEPTLVYCGPPRTSELVLVSKGVIIPYIPRVLKNMCQMSCLRRGERSRWKCQKRTLVKCGLAVHARGTERDRKGRV